MSQRSDGLREDWLIDPSCKVLQNPRHFCFNSDSAALAQFVRIRPGDRVLEIGTNNGALLVWCARKQPAFLCGVEISQEAAGLARINLKRSAACPWRVDAMAIQDAPLERFDVIFCNPPYFETGPLDAATLRDARHQARFVYDLDLETMIRQAALRLSDSGRFCFVHRPAALNQALSVLKENGLSICRLQIAYDRRDQQAKAILIEAVFGSGRKTVIEPPLWYGQSKREPS